MARGKRIFISYKRDRQPDEPLAHQIFERLKQSHDVFIDTEMRVGEKWAERIRAEIGQCQYLIVLLSADAIQSQMVIEEVRIAEAVRRETQSDFPAVLPVRVAYTQGLPYELGGMLNQIQYALWQSDADTASLLTQLEQVIAGHQTLPQPPDSTPQPPPADIPFPSANPRAPLEAPEGTMASTSPFYVERLCDRIARDEQAQKTYTLTIKGPRQMGKSSLLGHVMGTAIERGGQVAFLDFQSFGQVALDDANLFYPQFCFLIEDALDLPSRSEEFMKVPLAAPAKCTRFMERHVLPACGDSGLLLAIDEADLLLQSPWRSDFFGMLRAWHGLRSTSPQKWGRLRLAMVISTEPALLIDSLIQSPFNVGRTIDVEDFTLAEVRAANMAHGSPLGETELVKLHQLVGGQPYLCRKALYLMCQRRYSFTALEAEADSEGGPFGDHLRAHLIRLGRRPEVRAALYAALSTGKCPEEMRLRLMAAGLIIERNGKVEARCPLYRHYFMRVLRG